MASGKPNDSYVWISYSDLMTTVTFAFIFLLLGFIAANQQLNQELDTARNNSRNSQVKLGSLVKTKSAVGTILTAIREEVQVARECQGVAWSIDETGTAIRATFEHDQRGWFREGDANLTEEAKACLKRFAVLWLSKLYDNQSVRPNLQNLIVEGHTNSRPILRSENSFLDNLDLSQRRAFSAAKFILEDLNRARFAVFAPANRDWDDFIKWRDQKLTATGRSYSETLVLPDGTEDFEKSKRIVFRCLIKQDFNAMEQVSKGSG